MNTFKIDKFETTEFKNVYRVYTSNSMLIDIYEPTPTVKNFLNFKINTIQDTKNMTTNVDITTMNGTVIDKKDSFLYISFGGLLCKMPEAHGINKEDKISIDYFLS